VQGMIARPPGGKPCIFIDEAFIDSSGFRV
jgi:hypothetical protein